MAGLALFGIRVVDLSTGVAGPFCTKLFADFGADVVKIEPPEGDPARGIGPLAPGTSLRDGGAFQYLNTNKRGVTLDFDSEVGRDRVRRLVSRADVVVESGAPGELARMALAYEDLIAVRPDLVMASVTPFGQTGPWRDYQSTDIVQYAASGLGYINGTPDREPLKEPGIQSEFHGGTSAFLGAMAALSYRDFRGVGQHIDVSTLEALTTVFAPQLLGAMYTGRSPGRRTPGLPAGLLACKDGYVALNVRHQITWEHLWIFFGEPEIADDPRYATARDRRDRNLEVDRLIGPRLMRYTMQELLHGLSPLRINVGMTLDMAGLVDDEHIRARGSLIDVELGSGHTVNMPGAPFKMSATPWQVRRPAPALGEHDDDVFAELDESDASPAVAPSANVHEGALPLEHVRAVVLTQAWAGALTTQLLADLGAEVIQVEALTRADVWRGGFPPHHRGTYPDDEPGERPYDRNALFNAVNHSKLGITFDLNTEAGKSRFLELVSISDFMVENYAARVIPNFGLEYPALREVNPSIVMMRMPSFGASGPYSMYPGNGGTTEPMSGIASVMGYPDGQPINSGCMHTDSIAGVMGLGALLIAMRHRYRTGEGQEIDFSQQEAAMSFIADQIVEYTTTGKPPPRLGNGDRTMAPHSIYRCREDDTWVAIAVRSDAEWVTFCGLMGRDDLVLDVRFTKAEDRVRSADELDAAVAAWTGDRDPVEIAEFLQGHGIPAAAAIKGVDVPNHPQHKARGYFETVDHPATGPYPIAGVPFRLSRTPGCIRWPAPTLGQHSELVLKQHLAVSDADYDDMVRDGITGTDPPLD